VKLVYLNENETLTQGLIRKRIFLPGTTDGDLVMHQKHKYCYQVQQQMFVTEKTWGDLVIKRVKELPDRSIVDTEGVFISTSHFNSEFWSSVLPKLEAFYNEHILVELAYPRVKYGLPRLNMRDVYATFKITIILFVFIFSWDHCKSQEKLETILMQNFGGQTKSIIVLLKVVY